MSSELDNALFVTSVDDKNYKFMIHYPKPSNGRTSIVHFRNKQGIFLAYDITDQASFKSLSKWNKFIPKSEPQRPPVIVLGMKKDLDDVRVVSRQAAVDYATLIGARYVEVSSKTRSGFNNIMRDLVADINARAEKYGVPLNASGTAAQALVDRKM